MPVMRLRRSPRKRSWLLLSLLLVASGLWSQTLNVVAEHPAGAGLLDVLVEKSDSLLQPRVWVFETSAKNVTDNTEFARWALPADGWLSPANSLLSFITFGAPGSVQDEPRKFELRVRNAQGEDFFYRQGALLDIREKPFVFPSETQKAVVVCSYWGDRLTFYGREGRRLNERQFNLEGTRLKINPKGLFTADGQKFLFNLSRTLIEQEKAGPDLFLFLSNGALQWQYQLPLKTTRGVGLAPSGRTIVVCGTIINRRPPQPPQQTILFDSTGRVVTTFPVAFQGLDFSADENWLLLSDRHAFTLVNLLYRNIHLSLKPVSGRRRVTAACFLPYKRILVLTGTDAVYNDQAIYDDPEILVYDYDGHLLLRHIFDQDYTFKGKIIANADRTLFGLTFQNRFLVLTLDK